MTTHIKHMRKGVSIVEDNLFLFNLNKIEKSVVKCNTVDEIKLEKAIVIYIEYSLKNN